MPSRGALTESPHSPPRHLHSPSHWVPSPSALTGCPHKVPALSACTGCLHSVPALGALCCTGFPRRCQPDCQPNPSSSSRRRRRVVVVASLRLSCTYPAPHRRRRRVVGPPLSCIHVFKTALCYGVVSGCFVHGVSPSSRLRPELAPKRGLGGPGLAFRERPKVRAKSMQNLLGHNAAW